MNVEHDKSSISLRGLDRRFTSVGDRLPTESRRKRNKRFLNRDFIRCLVINILGRGFSGQGTPEVFRIGQNLFFMRNCFYWCYHNPFLVCDKLIGSEEFAPTIQKEAKLAPRTCVSRDASSLESCSSRLPFPEPVSPTRSCWSGKHPTMPVHNRQRFPSHYRVLQ